MKAITKTGQVVNLTTKQAQSLKPDKLQEYILEGTETRFSKTKTGKRKLEVFDKITGKKLSLSKFRKYLKIDPIFFEHLRSEEFYRNTQAFPNIPINQFISTVVRTKEFTRLVDIDQVEYVASKYKELFFNDDLLKRSEFLTQILDLRTLLWSHRNKPMNVFLKLWISYDSISVWVTTNGMDKFIRTFSVTSARKNKNVKRSGNDFTFVDADNNFVVMGS